MPGTFFADTIAAFATDLRYDDLPPEVARAALTAVADTLGCASPTWTTAATRRN